MQRLSGKVAIVTGGVQGIGLATVERLRAEGARVLIVDIKEWAGSSAADRLTRGDDIRFTQADVSNRREVDRMVETAVSEFGAVDVLVSNAGVARRTPFLELTDAAIEEGLRVNLISMILCGQAAARQMHRQGRGGAIVHLSSVNAVMAIPGFTVYNVSKGGVEQLTRVMALELAPFGIRVNAVGPGTIVTEMTRNAVLTDEAGIQTILSRTPIGRLGEPQDVAAAVAFLASEDSAYITGETIFIDGGRRALNYVVPRA